MDPALKKHKADENGFYAFKSTFQLTPEDARKILEPFTTEQLLEILQDAAIRHPNVLDTVRNIANRNPVQHKHFIHGLGWETDDDLRSLFSSYRGLDNATGKSKGHGFIIFKRVKHG